MKSEPVLTVASLTSLVTALVALLVAFGVPLSDDQQKALLGLAAVVAPIVAAAIARRRVTPTT